MMPSIRRTRLRPFLSLAIVLSCIIAVSSLVSPGAPAMAVQPGQILYSPDLTVFPNGKAGYPRAIRVDYDGINAETMLATFAKAEHNAPGTLPVYRSTNGGTSWSQISTIVSNTPGWDIEAPTIFEVPRNIPGLNQGDILAAGTAWDIGNYTTQKIEVFKSTDKGQSWQYLSNCTQTSGQPNSWGHGIWEPTFLVADDNTLACFISDERPANSVTSNQIIGHYTSVDGGASWSGTLTQDVAFPSDNLQRPGMQTFAELPNGQFVMSYEMCRDATDPDQACEVHIKFSPDGLNWGPLNTAGTLVTTADSRQLLHTPYVSWMPGGGPDGTILISGQRVVTGPTGNKSVMSESGTVLFQNTNLGMGPWTEIEAPVTVNPTGGYAAGVASCPGYSTPTLPREDGTSFVYFATTYRQNNQCELKFGIGSLPGPVGVVVGPGGKCLDVDTNTANAGRVVQLYTCGTATGQRWSISADGTIRAFGKCLDVAGNATANFSPVQIWDCLSGASAQQWIPQANGSLRNPQSGRCLDLPQNNLADGTDLQIYDCNGLTSQIWTLPRQPTGPIVGPGANTLCVDVDTNTGVNGTAIQIWGCNGSQGQQWSRYADGTLRAFGKCMDLDGAGTATANGAKVELWTCDGSAGQQWIPQTNGPVRNPPSGRCLDLPAGNLTPGVDLKLYDCNGQWPQQWKVPV